jgi:type II secretory pathway component GspD/PulD (secretin)
VALLLEIDPPGRRIAVPMRTFVLKHAQAVDVARTIRETLGLAQPASAATANPLAQMVDFTKMGEQLGNRQMLEAFVPGVSFKNVAREAPRDPVPSNMAIDPYRNALLIRGDYEVLGAAAVLVAALDVPPDEGRNAAHEIETRAITIPGGRAEEVAEALKAAFQTRAGFAVSGYQDKLVLRAERSFLAEVEATARRLAEPPVEVAVVPVGGSARIVAAQVAELFANLPASARPVLVADPDDSRVAVKGPPSQVAQVRRLLANLDADPVPQEKRAVVATARAPPHSGAAVREAGKRP